MKNIDQEGYTAALYIRLSKEDEGESESESIANQRKLLLEFASINCIPVYDFYIDDGVSGTTFDRPGFCRMIADIEEKKVNMVITKDMSRLGRDYIQTGYYMERYFPEHGVRYLALLDGVDTASESSANDISPFRAIMNDMYAKDTSRKIRSVKRYKQKQGLFIGGKAYYGYKLSPDEKNKIIIDDEAAAVVRRIFAMALAGRSCREIAGVLNAEGIPTPAEYAALKIKREGRFSGLWSGEKISHMLKNQVYIGNMVQGRVKKLSYKSKMVVRLPPEQWAVAEGTHEPIIEEEDFRRVGELLSARAGTRHRRHDYLLRGLFYCRECGHKLGVTARKLVSGEALYFFCRNYRRLSGVKGCTSHSARADRLCAEVAARLTADVRRAVDPATLAAAAANRPKAKEREKTQALSQRLSVLSKKLDALYEDRASGLLEQEDFSRMYDGIRKEREELQRRIAARTPRSEDAEREELILEAIRFFGEADKNRLLLFSMIERIELGDDKSLAVYVKYRQET